MSENDKDSSHLDVDGGIDFRGIPREARVELSRSFGGGITGAIVATILLAIGVGLINGFVSFVHSLDIPVISYIFSPSFREFPLGFIVFVFALFGCIFGAMFLVVGMLMGIRSIIERIHERFWR